MRFYFVARAIVFFILSFGYRLKVFGADNIPKDRGLILAANHTSNLDPIFLGIGCKRQVRYMAKQELFSNKFFGFILRHLGAFPVSRGTGDTSAIDTAISVVCNNGILGIFPEGSRSKDGKLKKAKSGAVLVASKTGGDIVPVGIVYGSRRFIRRDVTVSYGVPIPNQSLQIEDNSRADLKHASELLMGKIADLIGAIHD